MDLDTYLKNFRNFENKQNDTLQSEQYDIDIEDPSILQQKRQVTSKVSTEPESSKIFNKVKLQPLNVIKQFATTKFVQKTLLPSNISPPINGNPHINSPALKLPRQLNFTKHKNSGSGFVYKQNEYCQNIQENFSSMLPVLMKRRASEENNITIKSDFQPCREVLRRKVSFIQQRSHSITSKYTGYDLSRQELYLD